MSCDRHIFPGPSASNVSVESFGRIIEKLRVINAYSRYNVESLPGDGGYILRVFGANDRTPTVDIPVEEAKTLWRMSDWQIGDLRFQHLDAGLSALLPETNLINLAILSLAQQNPEANIRVRFSPQHVEERNNLYFLGWRMHQAVLRKYEEKKHYLSDLDFAQLTWATEWSDNTDVFGLMSGDPKPADQMMWDELYDRLALTMQITYFGRRDYFRPSVRAGLYAANFKDIDKHDMLPFEFRLDPSRRDAAVKTVYERFARATTCELTRYARFSDVPRAAHDLFLLKILERVESRGMRTILASVDEITAAVFRRAYGFKVMMQLPTHQTEEKEYLAFIEVGTPQYEAIKARIKQSANKVMVRR